MALTPLLDLASAVNVYIPHTDTSVRRGSQKQRQQYELQFDSTQLPI